MPDHPTLDSVAVQHARRPVMPAPAPAAGRAVAAVALRRIREDDVAREVDLFDRLSETTRRQRFLYAINELDARLLERFTHVDFDRDMALVARCETTAADPTPEALAAGAGRPAEPSVEPVERFLGVARYFREDATRAEFAIVVADPWQRHGLGRRLMLRLLDEARRVRLDTLVGYVHRDNRRMIAFTRSLGARIAPLLGEPGIVTATFDLRGLARPADAAGLAPLADGAGHPAVRRDVVHDAPALDRAA